MGYLVSIHLTERLPDAGAVRAALPPSIGFRVYRHDSLEVYAIDTFGGAEPPRYPFTSPTPATDISLELGPHLSPLANLYEHLRRSGGANCIKRSYINLAESLSEALGQPVLTICADDDEMDFSCLAERGAASVVTALCDEAVVRYANGTVEVAPADEERELHHYAAEAFEAFTGASAEAVGLGSWEPPEDFGFVRVEA